MDRKKTIIVEMTGLLWRWNERQSTPIRTFLGHEPLHLKAIFLLSRPVVVAPAKTSLPSGPNEYQICNWMRICEEKKDLCFFWSGRISNAESGTHRQEVLDSLPLSTIQNRNLEAVIWWFKDSGGYLWFPFWRFRYDDDTISKWELKHKTDF